MARELVIYTDESISVGSKFSDFYGGLLVDSLYLEGVTRMLSARKAELGLVSEVKWEKIDSTNHERYCLLLDSFFGAVDDGKIKVRIMFTQNDRPGRRSPPRTQDTFFKLYYQFLKHGFGLRFAGRPPERTRVRLLLDQLPDTKERGAQFRGFLAGLSQTSGFRAAGVFVDPEQIIEVRSHDHVLMQCLDTVLGAMQFRLNDKHKAKPAGAARRGKRTVAKEAVYRHISARIRRIRPHFNIGITTGQDDGPASRWMDPYRHWLFQPAQTDQGA